MALPLLLTPRHRAAAQVSFMLSGNVYNFGNAMRARRAKEARQRTTAAKGRIR